MLSQIRAGAPFANFVHDGICTAYGIGARQPGSGGPVRCPAPRPGLYQGVHFASPAADATARSMKRTPRAPSSTRG